MKIDLSQFRQTFLQESADHVASMEAGLLALRSAADDGELLNGIFRSAHSIKGGAGSFGMESLARFTHSLENLLERLRSKDIQVSDEIIAILLQSVDVLREMLGLDPGSPLPEGAAALMARIAALKQEDVALETLPALELAPPGTPIDSELKHAYRVEFSPDRELFASGTNPIVLLRNLAGLGTFTNVVLNRDETPPLEEMDPTQCYLRWTIELESPATESEIREVFEFVGHLAEISVQPIELQPQVAETPAQQKHITKPNSSREAQNFPKLSLPSDATALAKKASSPSEVSSIRVATNKVDRLIDLVGELVIAHVMTAQMVNEFEPGCLPKLREAVAAMERNTRELHERVMGIRMLPVGTLFQRYSRTVYDIAQATGKHIKLELTGEDTEIDKSMLELLGDPLTHLVRNAADHGIERPELRQAAGKESEGTIVLKAFHRAGRVVIEITDDGAGIDAERIRQIAVERGLISAETPMSEEQLRLLIFEPGFSTKEKISDLSGRGVGMDVVKRNVQQLNGTVMVESKKGRGSTVTIELPLTLAILDGLLVRVDDRTLVLPLLAVIETVPLRDEQIVRVAELGEIVVIREESIPLLRLSRYLNRELSDVPSDAVEDEATGRQLTVIVEAGRRKVGLVVDELLGQQQVVVKSLEKNLYRISGLMGATILGDGCVAPIVDVDGIAALDLFSIQSALKMHPQVMLPSQPIRAALNN